MFDKGVEKMLSKKDIQRINELAKKKKQVGLTDEEKQEQAELRQKYLTDFRAGFKNHIENIKIVDEEGNDLTSEKVKKIQSERKRDEKL